MATFQERLKQAIGNRGYEHCMRRSVQTVILYEAYRCIEDKIASLRPFQRKLAFFDQAMALIEATDLLPHQREEVMWRTGTSKEPMLPETAWKRMRLIEKEIEKLAEKIKPLCIEGKNHDEICNEFIQQQYEQVTGQKGKPYPSNWDHSHNNVILAYRMYYDGAGKDPTFPPADPPKEIVVPASKPKTGSDTAYYIAMNNLDNHGESTNGDGIGRDDFSKNLEEFEPAEDRRGILKEVREHLDLLKEFDGVISDEALKKRKRELFAALPAAPPSTSRRFKRRRDELESASAAGATREI